MRVRKIKQRKDPADTQFKAIDQPLELAKSSLSTVVPVEVDRAVRSLPVGVRSAWLRRVISEAAARELSIPLDRGKP